MKVKMISLVIGVLGTVTKGLEKETGGLRIDGTSGDYQNSSIVEIGQNTKKSPGYLICCLSDPSEKLLANTGDNKRMQQISTERV